MAAEIIPTNSPEAIPRAIQVLQEGGLIAIPTDTVYGVAAPAMNQMGIDRLFKAKRREMQKAIAVLIGSLDQLDTVAFETKQMAAVLAKTFWPGALTIIMQKHPSLPGNISPDQTIGVRMPDHSFSLSLLEKTGPLATTSANISGRANPLTAREVNDQLGKQIELIIDGKCAEKPVPSTVVDCTGSQPIILRQGLISKERLMNAFSSESAPQVTQKKDNH